VNQNNDFQFLAYVAADARRYHVVFGSNKGPLTFARLLFILISPRFLPVLLCRLASGAHKIHLSPLAKLISLVNFIIFGIEIAIPCHIGKGLILPHTQGTVIGARFIGKNATIFQGVTLGAKQLDPGFAPHLRPQVGDNVTLGAGAKVIGDVSIGSNASIGANSVVISDIPDRAVAVGVPAKVIEQSNHRKQDPSRMTKDKALPSELPGMTSLGLKDLAAESETK
jgi:serine O-acetyltransferase